VPCDPINSDIDVQELFDAHFPQIEKNYPCKFCDKCFANKQNANRHMKNCTITLADLKAENEALKTQLHAQSAAATTTAGATTTTNIANSGGYVENLGKIGQLNNNCTTNIHVNAFGQENIDYIINSPTFEQYVLKLLNTRCDGLMKLIEDKYFHPDHPENHTLNKSCKKDKVMKCYDGERWCYRMTGETTSQILTDLEPDINLILNTRHNPEISPLPENLVRALQKFMTFVGNPLNYKQLKWETRTQTNLCRRRDFKAEQMHKTKINGLVETVIYEKTKAIKSQAP
jgi:hypothetical protein